MWAVPAGGNGTRQPKCPSVCVINGINGTAFCECPKCWSIKAHRCLRISAHFVSLILSPAFSISVLKFQVWWRQTCCIVDAAVGWMMSSFQTAGGSCFMFAEDAALFSIVISRCTDAKTPFPLLHQFIVFWVNQSVCLCVWSLPSIREHLRNVSPCWTLWLAWKCHRRAAHLAWGTLCLFPALFVCISHCCCAFVQPAVAAWFNIHPLTSVHTDSLQGHFQIVLFVSEQRTTELPPSLKACRRVQS